MQGLINASLKVHAIEQDQKQSTAMMACRTYFYLPTWEDRLQRAGSGQTRTRRGAGAKLEVKIIEVKFSKCEKPTQLPPAQQCQTCDVHVCPPCDPATDAAVCPVCEGSILGVEVAAPTADAEAIR